MAASSDNYGQIQDLVGSGGFGHVFRTLSGHAVKIMKLGHGENLGFVIHEISIPLLLDHPHVIKYDNVEINTQEGVVKLTMTLYQGDLKSLSKGGLRPEVFESVSFQMVNTLAYLHRMNIIHCDIKPHNFLYRETGPDKYHVVLADFGFAVNDQCQTQHTLRQLYSWNYRAPEISIKRLVAHSSNADVWALACTLYQIYTGKVLFVSHTLNQDFFRNLFDIVGFVSPASEYFQDYQLLVSDGYTPSYPNIERDDALRYDEKLRRLLIKMLKPDPEDRITIFQVLADPYFGNHISEFETNTSCPTRVGFYTHGHKLGTPGVGAELGWELIYEYFLHYDNDLKSHILCVDLYYRYLNIDNLANLLVQHNLLASLVLISSIFFKPRHYSKILSSILKLFKVKVLEVISHAYLLLQIFEFDLACATPYDRICAMKQVNGDDTTERALKLLVASGPIPEIYTRPDLVEQLIEAAQGYKPELYQEIVSFYQVRPDLKSKLDYNIIDELELE